MRFYDQQRLRFLCFSSNAYVTFGQMCVKRLYKQRKTSSGSILAHWLKLKNCFVSKGFKTHNPLLVIRYAHIFHFLSAYLNSATCVEFTEVTATKQALFFFSFRYVLVYGSCVTCALRIRCKNISSRADLNPFTIGYGRTSEKCKLHLMRYLLKEVLNKTILWTRSKWQKKCSLASRI